jgi:hypothetical protein
MKEAKPINLGENHRRAIGTVAFMLDQMLCDFEAYARGREVHGLLYHQRNRLSPRQRQAILDEAGRIRAVLKQLQESLGLEPRVEDVSREIRGRGSMFWENLVETGTKHLRRYGATPPGLADYLDPKIEMLIEHLETIVRIASGKMPGRGPDAEEPQSEPQGGL